MMSFGEGWFLTIESIIKRKFKIKNPIFIVDKQKWDRNKIIHWAEHIIEEEERWIKYKHLSEDIFELKDFSIDPSNEICEKMATEFINSTKLYTQKNYQTKTFFMKIGRTIYSEKESFHEIIKLLREGRSDIDMASNFEPIKDPKPSSNRIIFEYWGCCNREIDVDIEEGFLELENKF